MISAKYLILYCLLIILSSSLSAQQSVELQRLSRDADVIVTGKVTKQQSHWINNKAMIITYTTIKAEDYLKGNVNNNYLVVSHPGGEVDGVGEIYTHLPSFKDNEEVLLFLKNDKKNNNYNVLYGEDGKIAILNSKSGEKITASNVPVKLIKTQIQKYVNQQ